MGTVHPSVCLELACAGTCVQPHTWVCVLRYGCGLCFLWFREPLSPIMGETNRPQGGRNWVLGPAMQGNPQTWLFSWELEELGAQHLCAYSVREKE